MPQPIDLEEIIKTNPKVDSEQLAESMELSKRLRDLGFQQARPALPFTGRRARIMDDLDSDPRVTRLCDLRR